MGYVLYNVYSSYMYVCMYACMYVCMYGVKYVCMCIVPVVQLRADHGEELLARPQRLGLYDGRGRQCYVVGKKLG